MSLVPEPQNDLAQMKRLSSREARNQFADLLGQVHYTSEPVLIERSGKPMVVMLSVDAYEKLLTAGSRQMNTSVVDPQEQPDASVDEPLFGAFPELAAITEDDLQWAKGLWNESLERQIRIINGEEDTSEEDTREGDSPTNTHERG